MSNHPSSNELAAELALPWYVNGTLSEAERRDVDEALTQSSRLLGERRYLEHMRSQLRAVDVPPIAPGLDRVLARLAVERVVASANDVVQAQNVERRRWAKPLLALAASLVVVQAGAIAWLVSERASQDPLRGTAEIFADARLVVSFAGDAPEREIRFLVNGVGGRIVNGPGDRGIYEIAVHRDDIEITLKKVRDSAIVRSVDILR